MALQPQQQRAEVRPADRGCCCAGPCCRQVNDDTDLANVAAVSAGNNPDIGKLISDAMAKVRRQASAGARVCAARCDHGWPRVEVPHGRQA